MQVCIYFVRGWQALPTASRQLLSRHKVLSHLATVENIEQSHVNSSLGAWRPSREVAEGVSQQSGKWEGMVLASDLSSSTLTSAFT